jgi:hypothetical protein
MKKKDLRELLTRHADALVHGEDLTSDLVEDYGHKDDQIESLLALATLLKDALVPVADPALMGPDWTTLADSTTSSIIIRQTKRFPEMWYLFAILGSLMLHIDARDDVAEGGHQGEDQQQEKDHVSRGY